MMPCLMPRVCAGITVVTGAVSLGLAADPVAERLADSPRHHEWIDVSSGPDRTIRCWIVYPENDRPTPAVVLIHENRGLNDWARSLADQVAEAGFLAVAPDLLSGAGPGGGTEAFASSDDARTAIYKLAQSQVLGDLDAVVARARRMPASNGNVSVAGFCWGGGQAFQMAGHNGDIVAAFVFYGRAPEKESVLRNIRAPVYGFYGGNDFRITGQVPAVLDRMKALGKKFEPVTYEGAGHGFMRTGEVADAAPANRKARAAAWARWNKLLSGLPLSGL